MAQQATLSDRLYYKTLSARTALTKWKSRNEKRTRSGKFEQNACAQSETFISRFGSLTPGSSNPCSDVEPMMASISVPFEINHRDLLRISVKVSEAQRAGPLMMSMGDCQSNSIACGATCMFVYCIFCTEKG